MLTEKTAYGHVLCNIKNTELWTNYNVNSVSIFAILILHHLVIHSFGHH